MLEALGITLREGMEAALLVGIILAYLNRTGRPKLRSSVYWGLGLGVLGSAAGAVALEALGVSPDTPLLEGVLLLVAGALVGGMVFWLQRTARSVRGRMERGVEAILGDGPGRLGLVAFTFFNVLREGLETVLFLAAASLDAGRMSLIRTLPRIAGGLTGIAVAVLLAAVLARGTLKVNLRPFFSLTTAILAVLTLRLVAGGLHEFIEAGLLPLGSGLGEALEWVAKSGLISGAITLLVLALLVYALATARFAAKAGGRPSDG